MKRNKAITLIALIVTILIIIILAGVSILFLIGDNGILNKALEAKKATEESEEKTNQALANYNTRMDEALGVTTRGENTITMTTLFENIAGAVSGTLSDNINNYDLITIIHGTAISNTYMTSITVDPKVNISNVVRATFNFASGSASIYGSFNLTDNTFTRSVAYDNGSWSSRYLLYKIVGTNY